MNLAQQKIKYTIILKILCTTWMADIASRGMNKPNAEMSMQTQVTK